MSDKSAKKKAKKASKTDAQPSVLGSLPATRPNRLGRTRAGGTNGAKPKAATASPSAATRKPKAATKTSAKPRSAAARPKAGATSERTAAARPKAGATSQRAAGPKAGAASERPAAARPEAAPRPSPPGVVTTAVQAVGEVAQIGVTVGRQILSRAASRIPRP